MLGKGNSPKANFGLAEFPEVATVPGLLTPSYAPDRGPAGLQPCGAALRVAKRQRVKVAQGRSLGHGAAPGVPLC